ncbi:e8f0d1fe-4b68-493e-9217-087feedd9dd9 [Sclerotinia trifoliorum]|uniref:E8f0d1fe-4b68-493e-9217-087feedd9dd9 n=1 Tax=Sclerotinia trifoliorum TaxID=28548 RepID=A0A8H2W225_9HELO|nr:e8f0d1fe-4b68-493e-9217-087feedd9dd9 [Sclerotinia trifoliorum]
MKSRAHRDERIAAANLTFTNAGILQDAFFKVVETSIRTLPTLVDAGGVSVWLMINSSFALAPASGVGLAKSELDEIMRPTIMKLGENHVTHNIFCR